MFTLIMAPISMVALAAVVSIPLAIIDAAERKKRCRELTEKIRLYKAVCANETDDFERAYWLANIWNLQYERACLRSHKKKHSRTK